jgi:hypothetical protein
MSETMKVGELKVPSSSALPFNAFERALLADEATLEKVALAAAAVSAADDSGDANLRRDALEVLRDVVKFQLKMPADLAAPLAMAAATYGNSCGAEEIYAAVKKVWASKWNERAYLVSQSVRRGRGGASHGDFAHGGCSRGVCVRVAHR